MSEAPDYYRRIAGVRSWRVAPNLAARLGGLLWSPGMLASWPHKTELLATCDHGHTPPKENCGCGLYAFYRPTAEALGYVPDNPGEHVYHVRGVVSGAGDMILHESGWTAERAQVEAIFDGPDLHRLPRYPDGETLGNTSMPLRISLEHIAEAYGAEIIAPEDYAAFCLERNLELIDPSTL